MNKNSTPPNNFRKDINGLRAIAVLAVLLFHMFSYLKGSSSSFDYFGGGYIGVDIFFVISGFLMTAIIVRRLQAGTFSVWDFWKRRAARICPALLAVCVLVLLIGFVIQPPYVFEESCREVMRALLFISNFWFARDQGYFADAVVNKTLLHTWSLSVEWQFYLIYPLLLWAWAKFCSLRTLPHFIAALFIVSLGASFVLTDNKSYFILYTRAWELLIGGIIFTLPPLKFKPTLARFLEVTALLVIFLNMAFAEPMQGWEAWQVLPGVVASALLLWLKVEHSLLSNAVMQYTGKISYSMYLIHWPVITICSKLGLLHHFVLLLGFIIAYSALSYHLIEKKRSWPWAILIIYVLTGLLGQVGVSYDGATYFNDNYLNGNRYHDVYYGGKNIPEFGSIYHGTTPGTDEIILIGDSYARQYANFLNQQKIPFVGVFSDGQMQFNNVRVWPVFKKLPDNEYQIYFENYNRVLAQSSASKVVIGHNWRNYLLNRNLGIEYSAVPQDQEQRKQAVVDGVLDLADLYQDKDFYIIGLPVVDPRIGEDCLLINNNRHPLVKKIFSFLDCPHLVAADFSLPNQINHFVRSICEQRSNLHFIDPNKALCHEGVCRVITDDELLIFSDREHLSLAGAAIVGSYILEQTHAVQN